MMARQVQGRRVRYAVVGAGWIAQAAFMPGVARTDNSELAAVVSGDPEKRRVLAGRYGIRACDYDGYRALLEDPGIDAVYLALPNDQHLAYAVPALEAGLHLLLEKPAAVSSAQCRAIGEAARRSGAKLMVAYRLHFEPASLRAIELAHGGAIGRLRFFSSAFSQHVAATNHRATNGFWAGPVPDMGPYPINAARNLFAAEPIEVAAFGLHAEPKFTGFHDTVAVMLRFPEERIAQFTVSYAGDAASAYTLVGTEGSLKVEPGYGFGGVALGLTLKRGDKTEHHDFPATEQFGGQTQYFSDCILNDRAPEPDGEEGLLDVRVIEAIERALDSGQPQSLAPIGRSRRPTPDQAMTLPPVETPPLVNAHRPEEG